MIRKILLVVGGMVAVFVLLGLLFPVIGGRPITKSERSLITMTILLAAMDNHRLEYNDWPRGDSSHVVRILCGDNPRKIAFLTPDPREQNAQGEPIDAWGTPLRLNITTELVTVESAGADRTFGTADDLQKSKRR